MFVAYITCGRILQGDIHTHKKAHMQATHYMFWGTRVVPLNNTTMTMQQRVHMWTVTTTINKPIFVSEPHTITIMCTLDRLTGL